LEVGLAQSLIRQQIELVSLVPLCH
jgi:hypothetical protein